MLQFGMVLHIRSMQVCLTDCTSCQTSQKLLTNQNSIRSPHPGEPCRNFLLGRALIVGGCTCKQWFLHLSVFERNTGGIAQIEGRSLQDELSSVYMMLGTCPQENILWDSLTGHEHLLYYARLRGLKV